MTIENGALERVECRSCGASGFAPVYAGCEDRVCHTPGRFDVVACERCGLIQTNPRPTAEAIDRYYPARYGSFGKRAPAEAGLRARLRDLARLPYVIRWGEPGLPLGEQPGRALDVGAGNGTDMRMLDAAGWESWGIEPDEEVAAAARREHGIPADRLLVGAAEEAGFEPGSFEAILMLHVVEHLLEPAEVLRACARWLTPGGRLIIRCPNFGSLERRLFGRSWRGLDLPRHITHFTRPTLQRMLSEAGLRPVSFRPELQAYTLVASARIALDREPREVGERLPPHGVVSALLPLGSILAAAGYAPTMEVVAVAD